MKKEMLINVLQPEECRIAIIEDGVLEELYVERTSHESYVGNIYKGRIVNIEPSIQAAFVDFGVGRNGFLHVSDVEPAYYRHLEQRPRRQRRSDRGRDRGSRRRPAGPRHRTRGTAADADPTMNSAEEPRRRRRSPKKPTPAIVPEADRGQRVPSEPSVAGAALAVVAAEPTGRRRPRTGEADRGRARCRQDRREQTAQEPQRRAARTSNDSAEDRGPG